jgi:hypothetical protein
MIITKDKLKEVTGCDYYNGSILKSKFGYKFFGDKIRPLGNIVTFCTSDNMSMHQPLDRMVHFCIEIPNASCWGGVVFQRLFITIVADILSHYIKAPIDIENGNIYIRREFTDNGVVVPGRIASTYDISVMGDSALIHIGVNLVEGTTLILVADDLHRFQLVVEEAFHRTIGSIFSATSRVNS